MLDFNVKKIQSVSLSGPEGITGRDLMSPYVWLDDQGRFLMMARAVPRKGQDATDTGTIWFATSDDGVHFTATDTPAIAPGPGPEDIGGCEDPTVTTLADGTFCVYYTGVDASGSHGALCYAEGAGPDRLEKQGVALASTPAEGNVKEATVDRTNAGTWRLFYEFAAKEASRIGLAIGQSVAGPWEHQGQPFEPRRDFWDRWHLSTGPMLTTDKDRPVMFYNGATRDARWRIGWVAFDADYTKVVDRCVEPLISPRPNKDREDTDIVFAASLVIKDEQVWLYYSRADKVLERALIRRS